MRKKEAHKGQVEEKFALAVSLMYSSMDCFPLTYFPFNEITIIVPLFTSHISGVTDMVWGEFFTNVDLENEMKCSHFLFYFRDNFCWNTCGFLSV